MSSRRPILLTRDDASLHATLADECCIERSTAIHEPQTAAEAEVMLTRPAFVPADDGSVPIKVGK
jgi:hypothetical protein